MNYDEIKTIYNFVSASLDYAVCKDDFLGIIEFYDRLSSMHEILYTIVGHNEDATLESITVSMFEDLSKHGRVYRRATRRVKSKK